jgi:hypothetical protein
MRTDVGALRPNSHVYIFVYIYGANIAARDACMPGAEYGRSIIGPMSLEDLQQHGVHLVAVSGTMCVLLAWGRVSEPVSFPTEQGFRCQIDAQVFRDPPRVR